MSITVVKSVSRNKILMDHLKPLIQQAVKKTINNWDVRIDISVILQPSFYGESTIKIQMVSTIDCLIDVGNNTRLPIKKKLTPDSGTQDAEDSIQIAYDNTNKCIIEFLTKDCASIINYLCLKLIYKQGKLIAWEKNINRRNSIGNPEE